MNTWDFPLIGPEWLSNIIAAFTRFVEWFYGWVDAVFGGMT